MLVFIKANFTGSIDSDRNARELELKRTLGKTEESLMLASERKLRISFSLSPKLTRALDEYAESFKVTRSAFAEDALWIYLNNLDKHMKPENSASASQFQNKEAQTA